MTVSVVSPSEAMRLRTDYLAMRDVRKQFDARFCIEIAELQVYEGEVLTLLGPSGCGKTTTLRMVAGLETPDAGCIYVAGEEVYCDDILIPPERRKVGLVFQDYALFPHLTVAQNIQFGLNRYTGNGKDRTRDLLELTRLEALRDRYPHELSGGEQQRTALARSLAPNPHILLLDEPFSSLDATLRKELRTEVKRILRETAVTTILVTHDQEEALSMSDRLAIMMDGEVCQVGTPRELYWSPRNGDIARFMGDANFLPGLATGQEVTCVLGTLPIQQETRGRVQIMLRPEAISVSLGDAGPNAGRVVDIEYYGHDQLLNICLDTGEAIQARSSAMQPFMRGQRVHVATLGVFPVYPAQDPGRGQVPPV